MAAHLNKCVAIIDPRKLRNALGNRTAPAGRDLDP
jgi:hypothetical protein